MSPKNRRNLINGSHQGASKRDSMEDETMSYSQYVEKYGVDAQMSYTQYLAGFGDKNGDTKLSSLSSQERHKQMQMI